MAADEIARIVSRGRDVYDGDLTIRRAVERCLEIFGEAAKSVSSELREAHHEIPWSDMAKIRDRLSHHYHRIDPHSYGSSLSTTSQLRPTRFVRSPRAEHHHAGEAVTFTA